MTTGIDPKDADEFAASAERTRSHIAGSTVRVLPGTHEITGFHGKAARILDSCAQSGEPVFVLRAKDLLSVLAVRHYLELNENYGSDPELQEGIYTALREMMEWQRSNPGLVRLPD